MSYVALYRTYRPQCFNEVVGQEHIKRTLQNAIKQNKVAHAYLFSGPRGTGKTTIAKIFAKAVNCAEEDLFDSCNECQNCIDINKGSSDACIEMDAASNNGVDDVREIRDKVKYLPTNGKYKVYIIDEVHMLSNSAFNALLKTLEEPPKHIIFILATTEPNKVPATILSRCQRFDFRSVSIMDIEKRINEIVQAEKINIDPEAIKLIAVSAEGGMRDALSLLDQTISYGSENITTSDVHMVNGSVSNDIILDLVSSSVEKNNVKSLSIIDDLLESGNEIQRIINDLIQFYRNILLFKNINEYDSNNSLFNNEKFIELSKKISNKRLYFYLDVLNDTLNSIKLTNQKRVYLEMALIKMGDDVELQQVLEHERLKKLEARVELLEKQKNVSPAITDFKNSKSIKIDNQLERILNNGNKDKKEQFIRRWSELTSITDSQYRSMAHILAKGTVVAMNNDEMIIVYDDKSYPSILNKEVNKHTVVEILSKGKDKIVDYLAIDKDIWNEVMQEFRKQYKNGITKPVLGNIKIEVLETNVELKKENKALDNITMIFGKDKVEIKGEK